MRVELDFFFVFNGKCREAIEFYTKVFKIDPESILIYSYGDLNDSLVSDERKQQIIFAEFTLYDTRIFLADCADFYKPGFTKGNNLMMAIAISDKEEMERLFYALAEEGSILFEPQKTSNSEWLALVTDKYDIMWQFALSPKGPKPFV